MATTDSGNDFGTQGLPEHVIEDILADDHRRRALSILAARDEPIVVDDLAAAILAAERDMDPSGVPDSHREALTEELFTDHLPKLTATDIVTYDSMIGTVALQDRDAVPTDRL